MNTIPDTMPAANQLTEIRANIVCLGWGSLIWNSRSLPFRSTEGPHWHMDGPALPIEFARQSKDGRITLVTLPKPLVTTNTPMTPVLWAYLGSTTSEDAREELKKREGSKLNAIGIWTPTCTDNFDYADIIGAWARAKGLDCVVWTALGPKYAGERERLPTCDEVLRYVENLSGESRELAREYICRAPRQIATRYRVEIEQRLGWTYDGSKTDCEIIA